ncbi:MULTISPECIES: SAP domain-containing protein [unclassified Paenibacillus]|uniref:SAP domain-containing protein n=1 Tax=unclassified Paenibacillus TaxID=185978 RepID=UPI00119CE2C0|nr:MULTISPECIES: SAP domain-containing protein [Paenibacillaceae]
MNPSRPEFSTELTVEEFDRHYWYKEELENICRLHNIPATGTKAELLFRIKKWLGGEVTTDQRKANSSIRMEKEPVEISLDTRLIPDGFKFNQKAREFFARYYKQPRFSFTKEMAAALREAERRGDLDMTVADLIDIYEGKKQAGGPEESTYQWNQFVKDFNQDPNSKAIRKDRMKVAAHLWRQVRDQPGRKKYSPRLLENYLRNNSETTSK